MNKLSTYWTNNKALVIIGLIGLVVALYLVGEWAKKKEILKRLTGDVGQDGTNPNFNATNVAIDIHSLLDGFTTSTQFKMACDAIILRSDTEILEIHNAYISKYGNDTYPTLKTNFAAEVVFWTPSITLKETVLSKLNSLNL